ncbi:MAG: hypothetical protein JWO71_1875 [Candidatus Acidoferrum typicum]|nr:hypothetical protein [Candidatus Acidoferrum typicum]
MAAKDYIDPKRYFGDPEGNIHRMGDEDGEQRQAVNLCVFG